MKLLRCAAARPADFLCLAKESQQRNATPRRRKPLAAGWSGTCAAGLKTRCAQTIKPLIPPSFPAPAAAPKGVSGCFVVIEYAKEHTRKPAWIGRLRAGTSETFMNKGLQGMDTGDALNTRASGRPYLRYQKYSGLTLPKDKAASRRQYEYGKASQRGILAKKTLWFSGLADNRKTAVVGQIENEGIGNVSQRHRDIGDQRFQPAHARPDHDQGQRDDE